METLQSNIWEEKNLTEPETNYSNNIASEPNIITNDTEIDSTPNLCEDIGSEEQKRLQHNDRSRTYRLKNQAKIKEIRQHYYQTHPTYNEAYYERKKEIIKAKSNKYYYKNEKSKKKYRIDNERRIRDYNKQYYVANKQKLIAYRIDYCNKRRATDIGFRLAGNLRGRLTKAIRRNQKIGSAVNDLGCSMEAFKSYISSKFQPEMSWENYGEWHLDHIKPLSSFNLEDRIQFLIACHYTNYQPLWKIDNIRKSNKII